MRSGFEHLNFFFYLKMCPTLREGDVCGCGRGLGVGRQVWVCLENYFKDLKLQKD